MRVCAMSVAALLLSQGVLASPIDEIRELDADGSVSISNVRGLVKVSAGETSEVRIQGDLAEEAKLEISGDSRRLEIKVVYPESSGWFGGGMGASADTRLEIVLPGTASLDVSVVSAEVDVEGMRGAQLELESVSGNIDARALNSRRLKLTTVSGDIDLQAVSADTRIESVSGELRLGGELSGDLRIESVSGDVALESNAALSELDLEVVSGDVMLRHGVAADAQIRVESLSGDVHLRWPGNTSAELEVQTFSGDIESPVGEVEREEFGPGASLRTRLGAGAARIRIETFSGDAELILE
ncbi:MAG: DUF4097 family beta strand repeat-containing protein [Lysobacteraceae bacterium]